MTYTVSSGTLSLVYHTVVFGTKFAFDCLRFWKFLPHICESYGATYWHSYKLFSVLQSMSIPLTDDETPSKLIHNCRCYPSSKCCKIDQKHGSELGVLLWHHLMPQRKTTIWEHNYTPSGVQLLQSYCGKFTSCTTFDAHKHVRSQPFLDCLHKVWHLLLALRSDVRKFFCIGLHSRLYTTVVEFY